MSNSTDVFRILVATDNHLGYLEDDPVRFNDSFQSFEEVLKIAKTKNVDFVLLGGDLFHHSKPSRQCLHKTIKILRKYCMGNSPIQFTIVSDQEKNFISNLGRVNYEDPNYAVALPVFSIHGNHDEPTRYGADQSQTLAALDILCSCNLVNYFGKPNSVERVDIHPILFEKGETKLAIYGLGNIRDERLNRMFERKLVKFLRPSHNTDDWFNVLVLHQNRDYGRGQKNCVHEEMLPNFLNLIIWGHEHECIIQPQESTDRDFHITQPGSSVATSLVQGEGIKKHVGLLEIKQDSFRMTPIPLKSVRPFYLEEITLTNEIDADQRNVRAAVETFLSEKVEDIIDQNSKKYVGDEAPVLPLIRLKIDHTDFQHVSLQNQRFGAKFVDRVANPTSLLLFRRKSKVHHKKSDPKEENADLVAPICPDDYDVEIGDIIGNNLDNANKLSVLKYGRIMKALREFVDKSISSAIEEDVRESLKETQSLVTKQLQSEVNDDIESIVSREAEKHRKSEIQQARNKKSADSNASSTDNIDQNDRDPPVLIIPRRQNQSIEVEAPKSTTRSRRTRARITSQARNTKRRRRGRAQYDSDSECSASDLI